MQWLLSPRPFLVGMLTGCNPPAAENTRSARHDHRDRLQSRNSDASPGRHSIRALGFPADARYKAPWLAWFGGAYGAVALLSQPIAAPRLWAAMYIG